MSFNVKVQVELPKIGKAKDEFSSNLEMYLTRIGEFGVQRAKENLTSYEMPFATGELENSIHSDTPDEPNSVDIVADSDHAYYVEYGTGVDGATIPHPNPEVDWQYDVNGHGEDGWRYLKGGKLHWTKGMPSRPYMYRTSVDLEENAEQIAREVFND